MEFAISLLGLFGTLTVSYSKNMKVQTYGMYLWLGSNALAIPYFGMHHMFYLMFLNVAYALISIMGIIKRKK